MVMIATLLTFSLAAILLTLTPGLDTALILRTSIAEGRKNGFKAALGINAGCYIWGTIVALGLGALLAASQVAYDCLKWIGAAYLLWLAIQLILARPQPLTIASASHQPKTTNWFLRGCLGNVLNPKIGIFYVSFLPQFIPVGQSPVIWTFLLVSIHVAIGTLWSTVLINIAAKASGYLQQPKIIQWMNRVTAGVFVLFAAKLAFSSR
ncbi:lysine transporter LysE [bacteria symbiont BFo2 of Frankliniella occidentalis]|nr:lysine transporter LysE [bacteria symbiont BFo2 of Frankliniella occidentalis]KYP93033.1 lysine transporter LysE [bacteria symbiont BFo2 of Frankliniella occidentalis]KYP95056.1 lysine transporter LysE [bacteria symbiont BFo2 of Frankliniella occidentalis]